MHEMVPAWVACESKWMGRSRRGRPSGRPSASLSVNLLLLSYNVWAKTNVLLVVPHEIDEEIFKFTGNHIALLLAVIWKIQYLAYTVLLLLSTCK